MRYRLKFMLVALLTMITGLLTFGATPATAQGALALNVTIESATIQPKTGEVTLVGTVTCAQPSDVEIWGELSQNIGRKTIVTGFFGFFTYCAGPDGTDFSATVTPYANRFTPGTATLLGYASARSCDDVGCLYEDIQLDMIVRLTYGP
jgi:hypothetical protein